MKRLTSYLIPLTSCILMVACGPSVPAEYAQSDKWPAIYPDYAQVTVPVNIAPLSFEYDGQADEMVARYAVGNNEIVCNGQPSIDEWHALAEKAKGNAITVDVYTRNGDQWTRFKPFNIYVSPDSIDPYISYRLIAPSYVTYEALTINQRCLENYDESVIYDNILCGFEKDGQCINCHHYQQYNPQRMQFHARQNMGGTVIAYDGRMKKVNMRNDSILSAGVYPAWHPTLNLIVYATDKTLQNFHTVNPNKVEVYDEASDIIAYNVETDEVTNIENSETELEVFPAWAPDGKTLYYCSAHFERQDTARTRSQEVQNRFRELKYNIYRKAFDPETRQFGPRELVFDAAAIDSSATFPRISPDGRYLLFTMGHYGYFHIWHHEADLWMMDLASGAVRRMTEVNSPDTESYHSWSSNGRWIIFSSRRNDGDFTRPFIAHIDKNGHATKPFELPSEDPDYHRQFLRSYNVPEFMTGPVTITPQTFADILKGDAVDVKYVPSLGTKY
ncbi:MAG: PD40 domain-containing protein [Prevotella sp.]|nr:PD40 domain-containing protein [Prevotella sp.]